MTVYKQDDLVGKFGQKCRQCGNKEFFMNAARICQRCNYNNITGANISKKQMDFDDERSHQDFIRKVNECIYIFKRRCSVCSEFIEVPACEDKAWDKVENFMEEHAKKHIGYGKTFVHLIEDYDKRTIEIVKEK